jgi:hypothetical protein
VACCVAAELPKSSANSAGFAWLKLATANFELYTTAGEDAGRLLINRFENLRAVLDPILSSPARRQQRPVCVIAFQSRDEFQPYAPMGRSTGFYLPGSRCDFIVLDDPSTKTRTAAHEYGHVVMAQNGLRLPAWLNEGLAELYSNVDVEQADSHVVLGEFIESRVFTLRRNGWISLADLISPMANSTVFTNPFQVDAAYAESWLLAHMLVLDPAYAGHFQDLLRAVQSTGTTEAFGSVYGKSMTQVEWDLTAYLKGGQANMRIFNRGVAAPAQPVHVEREADFDARLALAEMLQHYRGRGEQAREAYQQLARDYPFRPEVEKGIAEIYRSEGNQVLAAEHRARSLMLHANFQTPQ